MNAPAPLLIRSLKQYLDDAQERWGNQVQIKKLRDSAPGNRFSFAVIGDGEPGRFPWQRIWAPKDGFLRQIRSIHAQNPHLIMQLGDFVSLGNEENYTAYVRFLDKKVKRPMVHVIGNHDRSTPNGPADKTLYRKVFGPSDFFFDLNGYRFIALDTADLGLMPNQLAWLESALQTPLRKLIFMHIPPKYLDGKLKSLDVDAEGIITPAYFTQGSPEMEALLAKYGAERVYMGHIHAYGMARHQGVVYILTGGGGSPLYPLPPGYPAKKFSHYIRVEANESGLKETVYPLEGNPFPLPLP